MIRERFDLASAVALASWTPFVVEAGGRLRYDASGQYSRARESTRYTDQNGWSVFEYTAAGRTEAQPPARSIEVRFKVEQLSDGDRIDQPTAFAVQRAITESGLVRGRVRLQYLSYEGRGRIIAVVGLQN